MTESYQTQVFFQLMQHAKGCEECRLRINDLIITLVNHVDGLPNTSEGMS